MSNKHTNKIYKKWRDGIKKQKIDKPVGIIWYHDRLRSPSRTDFYKYLKANNDTNKIHWEIVTDTGEGEDIEKVMKVRGLDRVDLCIDGLGAYLGSYVSREYIMKHEIPVARTMPDVEVHKGEFGPAHHKFNSEVPVSFLILFWNKECTGPTERLRKYTEDLPAQEDAVFEHIMYGVDTTKYKGLEKKDIDVMAVYLAEAQNPWQKNRMRMNKVSDKYMNWWNNNVNAAHEISHLPPEGLNSEQKWILDKFKGQQMYSAFIDIEFYKYASWANRSKICLADTSSRDYMVMKYLEFGASGAMVMGEKPMGNDDLFNAQTMCVIDMERIEVDLPQQIEYYIKNETGAVEREKKALKVRQIIEDNYTLEHWRQRWENCCMKYVE